MPESSLDKALEQAATAPVTPTPGVGRPVTPGSGLSGNFLPSNPPLKSQTKVKPQSSLMGSGSSKTSDGKSQWHDLVIIIKRIVERFRYSSILNKTITELAGQGRIQTAMKVDISEKSCSRSKFYVEQMLIVIFDRRISYKFMLLKQRGVDEEVWETFQIKQRQPFDFNCI